MKSRLFTLVVGAWWLPVGAFAIDRIQIFQPSKTTTLNFTVLANKFGTIANAVIPFLIGVAVVLAVWGIFKYITAAGDSEKMAEAKKGIIWSLVALFLMLSFWGFVLLIKNSFF